MSAVYLSYTQAELDDCYDQRVWARDAARSIAWLGTESAAARDATPHRADLAYGGGEHARLDWFPGAPGGPVHVHLHGGAWRNLSKADASFAAPAFTRAGIHYVAPHFPKLPAARLPDVIDALVEAMVWVHRSAPEHGADRDRILLSGHSSGAHLAAVLATLDWRARGLPADLFKAVLCVSGSYDLAPVLLSARGEYIRVSPEEARALSPLHHASTGTCPVTLVHAGRDSPEFVRQAGAFAAALRDAGRLTAHLTMPDADHFEVNEAFATPGSPVHDAALDALTAMRPSHAGRADAA